VIYQFDGDDLLEKVYATGDITIEGAGEISISGSSNANREATINLGPDATGPRTFYLVANVNGTSQVQSTALASVEVGTTDIDAFEEGFVTEDLTGVLALATPLPMSSTGIVVSNVTTPGNQEATLKRRVARFDIVNHKDFTNLTVTGVIVRNGNLSGEILDQALESYTGNTGDGEKVLVANGSGTIIPADDYNDEDVPALGLNENGLAKSLNAARFYLYPTTVTATATTGTEVLLEGTYKGVQHVFPLTLTTEEVEILANHVYQIVVNRATADELFTFSLLEVAEWTDGDPIASGIVASAFSGWLDKDGDPVNPDDVLEADLDFSDASTADEYSVEYKSTSALAPEVTLEPVKRPGDDVVVPRETVAAAIAVEKVAPVLTRALGTVYYKHVITIKLTQPSVPFKASLTIKDQEFGQKETYTLFTVGRYNGIAGLKPVLYGNVYWAPVNAGATTLVEDFSAGDGTEFAFENVGYYYQWGRNTPFWPGNIETTTEKFEDIDEADDSPLFYTGEKWYLESLDPGLWSGNRVGAICPEGWTIPNLNTLDVLYSEDVAPNPTTKTTVYTNTDTGKKLFLPWGGWLSGTDAGWEPGLHVWSCGMTYDGLFANGYEYFDMFEIISPMTLNPRYALPVRCIANIEQN
jgi:hypothetical protein